MANLQKRSFILLVLLKWVELFYQIAVFSLLIIAGSLWASDKEANSFSEASLGGKMCLPLALLYTFSLWYNNLFFNLRFKLCIVNRCECPSLRKCTMCFKTLNDDSCDCVGVLKALFIMVMAMGIVFAEQPEESMVDYRGWVWFVAL